MENNEAATPLQADVSADTAIAAAVDATPVVVAVDPAAEQLAATAVLAPARPMLVASIGGRLCDLAAERFAMNPVDDGDGPDTEDDADQEDDAQGMQFVPSSANDADRTIDCIWYGGASVPRMDYDTGEPYNLSLDMAGCRFDRLNAGAAVFDNHQTGDDFLSALSGKSGTRAQVGVVMKAWADGNTGKATLRFKQPVPGNPDGPMIDQLWSDVRNGIIQNLSFGTWIYSTDKTETDGKITAAAATDWEPFEISPVTLPADFTTQFLSAQAGRKRTTQLATQVPPAAQTASAVVRATSPQGEQPMEETTTTGTGNNNGARALDQAALASAAADAVAQERTRAASIRALGTQFRMDALATRLVDLGITTEAAQERFTSATTIRTSAQPMLRHGLTEVFINTLIDQLGSENLTVDVARTRLIDEFSRVSNQMRDNGGSFDPQSAITITRDERDSRGECMEAALLAKHKTDFYSGWANAVRGTDQARYEELVTAQRDLPGKARPYMGMRLLDMARECLSAAGVNTRGMMPNSISELAMQGRVRREDFGPFGTAHYFGGAESTSDFPSILANVANKTLRQAYEAYPQTFRPFCRQVTATDFKPINRVQLSDAPKLQLLGEKGEYARVALTDLNSTYKLAPYGHIIALTRQVIINDDLQAFTRIPGLQGVAASQLESDTVWGIITANGTMTYDSVALFATGHGNLLTGAGSALALTGMSAAETAMGVQTAPSGTPLNLIPRFVLVPRVLKTTLSQLIMPLQLAATAVTGVVPQWVQDLVPVAEARLDKSSTTKWYLVADPAQIDTIEYCYLEGQQGVYLETRQGFDVDGIEMKCRMDFGAAAIDHRGLLESQGT